jgi:hypothetical protein
MQGDHVVVPVSVTTNLDVCLERGQPNQMANPSLARALNKVLATNPAVRMVAQSEPTWKSQCNVCMCFCAQLSAVTFFTIVIICLTLGLSVSCIVIGSTNLQSGVSKLNIWPSVTAPEWLIVYGSCNLFLIIFNEPDKEKKKNRSACIKFTEAIISLFEFYWIIMGSIVIFGIGYSKQYFTYDVYIMISFCVYIYYIYTVCFLFVAWLGLYN